MSRGRGNSPSSAQSVSASTAAGISPSSSLAAAKQPGASGKETP